MKRQLKKFIAATRMLKFYWGRAVLLRRGLKENENRSVLASEFLLHHHHFSRYLSNDIYGSLP